MYIKKEVNKTTAQNAAAARRRRELKPFEDSCFVDFLMDESLMVASIKMVDFKILLKL